MRIIAFSVLFILVTFTPWYFMAILAGVYALHFFLPLELLVLAVLVDTYFGGAVSIPYYTVSILVLILCIEWIKPQLSFYNAS